MIRRVISELIGRVNRTIRRIYTWSSAVTRDYTKPDAEFYDKARRGKAQGLEISGLLLKPVESKIASWAMGRAPTVTAGTSAGEELSKWVRLNLADILRGYQDSLGLGDSYLVINPDLSVTVVPPHVVTRIVDPLDYSVTAGYRITERWQNPDNNGDWQTIEDEYTLGGRIRTIYNSGGAVLSQEEYPNLLGIVPVVHIANNRSSNQEYGTPETEALITALHEYGAVLDAALFGNKRMGRPTPVVKLDNVRALDKFWQDHAETKTRTLPDGTTETYQEIPFDSDDVMAIVGDFHYAQPGSFAGDTEVLLGLLYLLFVEHTELPEFVLGSAIASSKASADSQMPVFVRFIEKKRTDAGGWFKLMLMIVQAYMVLMGRIRASVPADEIGIQWEDLTTQDGQLTLATIQWALSEGLIDDETALSLAPVDIEDVAGVIARAQAERDAREDARREFDLQVLLANRSSGAEDIEEDIA